MYPSLLCYCVIFRQFVLQLSYLNKPCPTIDSNGKQPEHHLAVAAQILHIKRPDHHAYLVRDSLQHRCGFDFSMDHLTLASNTQA